ncbi:AarF/UbiB family protein [Methanotrichaceae archaeon Mx]|uniref:non-specific serine/threonine protein kinase n=1 Tax=Candidatus Methanocrinis natronophilus TaxID=3033396 RepID=A0ABT5X7Z5_9EURY|nr:AarF/UbiB family protein [Candidatus Methanocrinis natronophilus]
MENLAEAFLRLDRKEIALLKAIERGMRRSEWVPIEDLLAKGRLSLKGTRTGLSKLVSKKLVFKTTEPYEGYQIGFAAYDLIALSELVARGVVVSLGDLLGVGKESVVFEALGRAPARGGAGSKEDPSEEDGREKNLPGGRGVAGSTEDLGELIPLAVKFHRQGTTSFKHVRRARSHLLDGPRCAWIHAARIGAAREYKVLKALYPAVSVPEPVALSFHALVMEHMGGAELYKLDLENPKECLEIVLEEIAAAWRGGFVHADLSPYNVLVGEDGEIVIIDWPQAVSRTDPRSVDLLGRDVKNVIDHFERKYRLDVEPQEAIASIIAEDEN